MTAYKALTASLARTSLRDPGTLLFSFLFPPALLLVLALSAGDLPGEGGHPVVDDIGPNAMGFGIAFVGMFAGGTNIAEWREKGVIRVLRNAPMSVSAILGSALTVAVVSALIQSVLVVLVGIIPVVGIHLSAWAAMSVIPVFLGALFFYSLGVLIGLAVPTESAAAPAAMIVVVPMGFASGPRACPSAALPARCSALAPHRGGRAEGFAHRLRHHRSRRSAPLLGGHPAHAMEVNGPDRTGGSRTRNSSWAYRRSARLAQQWGP